MRNKFLFIGTVILIISGATLKVLINSTVSTILLFVGALGFITWLFLLIKRKR